MPETRIQKASIEASAPLRTSMHVTGTAFLALFSIVGFALCGLPFFYDFMVRDLGWTRAQVTSGNAYSKLLVGPVFGLVAGWIVDRFGPRRMMMIGIIMAGGALAGLGQISSLVFFYIFCFFNALGYVCGGPLPNQVLLSRWFGRSRGKAMGIAYIGIGIGGAIVPLLADWLTQSLGGDYMIIPLMAAELFGVRVLGRLMGVILTADGVAEALNPMAVALLRDTSGSYRAGFVVLIVLAAAGALAVSLLRFR
jgi:MFS family permease